MNRMTIGKDYGVTKNGNIYHKQKAGKRTGAVIGGGAYVVAQLSKLTQNGCEGLNRWAKFIKEQPPVSFLDAVTCPKLIKMTSTKGRRIAFMAGTLAACVGISVLIGRAIGKVIDHFKNKDAAEKADLEAFVKQTDEITES